MLLRRIYFVISKDNLITSEFCLFFALSTDVCHVSYAILLPTSEFMQFSCMQFRFFFGRITILILI